jgi:PAS domain S-box-containing protein
MTETSVNRWRVLLVDDDEDDYVLVRAMVDEARGREITVEWADSYSTGKECLTAHRYHAVLVDYDLGDANGLDLIREAAAQDYPAPLILYTGRGSYEIDVEAMEAGATMYLPKAEATPLLLERFIRYAIERKNAEINLRRHSQELEAARAEVASEKRRLEAVFDALPVGAAIVDEAGGLERYNQTYEQIWRGPVPNTQSVHDYAAYLAWWADSNRPLAPEEWASAQAVLKGETVVGQYLRIKRFDGSSAHVINSAAPIRSAAGVITGSAVTIQDITALHTAEQALKDREDEYRRLFEAMDEAVALMQIQYNDSGAPVDYVFLNVNTAFEEITGIKRSRVIGSRASEIHEIETYLQTIANIAKTGLPAQVETYVEPLDKYLHTAIFSTESGIVGIVFRNITDRMLHQAGLEQRQQKLQDVADAAPALLAYIDDSFTYRWMNKGYERWFGRPIEELTGRKVWEVLGEEAWAAVRGYMQQALTGEQIVYEQTLRFAGGVTRWVRGTYTPDTGADGQGVGFMVHVVDLGKRNDA